METTIRTEYDYKQLLNLQYFHIRRKRSLWGFVLLCYILILSLLVSSLYTYGWNPEAYVELALLVIILIAVPAMVFFSTRYGVRKSARLDALYHYVFSSEGFMIASVSERFKEDTQIKYKSVYRIYETKYCFYIYISKMQAYILDKNGFESGSCEDLRALFRAGVNSSALKIYD